MAKQSRNTASSQSMPRESSLISKKNRRNQKAAWQRSPCIFTRRTCCRFSRHTLRQEIIPISPVFFCNGSIRVNPKTHFRSPANGSISEARKRWKRRIGFSPQCSHGSMSRVHTGSRLIETRLQFRSLVAPHLGLLRTYIDSGTAHHALAVFKLL